MVTKILLSLLGKQKLVIKASFPIFGFCNQKQLNKIQYTPMKISIRTD